MEQLDRYKYFGMFIDDKLSFDHRTEDLQEGTSHIICIACAQPLFCRYQLYDFLFLAQLQIEFFRAGCEWQTKQVKLKRIHSFCV